MSDAPPDSLLPYERWTENALRAVVADALEHVGREGLPGEHHFYISFRTDHPGVNIPAHLRARYPREITIILQHRFWDLAVDRAAQRFTVGLSFGGVPAKLDVPLAALTAFHDPHVRFGLRFEAEMEEVAKPVPEPPAPEPAPTPEEAPKPQVVSLEAFRRKRD
jgi:uncharacterized protein